MSAAGPTDDVVDAPPRADADREGQDLAARVMDFRRAAIAEVLQRLPATRRRALVPAVRTFADAGGEPEAAAWSSGRPTAD